jgi:hypothetical protein
VAGSPSPETAKHRARVAGITLKRGADDPEVEMARRDLEVSKLADHIQRVLAQAPPLTGQQRAKLAELLRPVRRAPKAAATAETHAEVIAKRTTQAAQAPPSKMPRAPHIPASIRGR